MAEAKVAIHRVRRRRRKASGRNVLKSLDAMVTGMQEGTGRPYSIGNIEGGHYFTRIVIPSRGKKSLTALRASGKKRKRIPRNSSQA